MAAEAGAAAVAGDASAAAGAAAALSGRGAVPQAASASPASAAAPFAIRPTMSNLSRSSLDQAFAQPRDGVKRGDFWAWRNGLSRCSKGRRSGRGAAGIHIGSGGAFSMRVNNFFRTAAVAMLVVVASAGSAQLGGLGGLGEKLKRKTPNILGDRAPITTSLSDARWGDASKDG